MNSSAATSLGGSQQSIRLPDHASRSMWGCKPRRIDSASIAASRGGRPLLPSFQQRQLGGVQEIADLLRSPCAPIDAPHELRGQRSVESRNSSSEAIVHACSLSLSIAHIASRWRRSQQGVSRRRMFSEAPRAARWWKRVPCVG